MKNKNNTLGENIAAGRGTPECVVDQWMHSEGHRANILNPVFKGWVLAIVVMKILSMNIIGYRYSEDNA